MHKKKTPFSKLNRLNQEHTGNNSNIHVDIFTGNMLVLDVSQTFRDNPEFVGRHSQLLKLYK